MLEAVEHIQARSFGGCDTCRSRRVKCDESRPTCGQCTKARIHCGGYSKTISFELGETDGNGRTRFRRPLLSERARRDMSEQLASSVPEGKVLLYLTELDERCQGMPPDDQVDICYGPFGAFKTSATAPSTAVDDRGPEPGQNSHAIDEPDPGHLPFSPSDFLGPVPIENLAQILGDPDLILDPEFNLPVTDSSSGPAINLQDYYSDTFAATFTPVITESTIYVENDGEPSSSQSAASMQTSEQDRTTLSMLWTPTANIGPTQGVLFLMQHFSTTVLTYLTPIRHEKSPWHILFLPHMRNCLALLTLGQHINRADMSTFQGLLAISALSIGHAHQSQTWLEQGIAYKHRAYQEVRMMLQGAYDTPKKYKYKSILMALQIAVFISTLGGDPVTEEYYFLETEKFIKLKGLGRKRSRKVRLLHRCYAFERLLYESTCMRGIDPKHRRRVRNDIKSVSLVPYHEDGMAFRFPDWHNLDEQVSKTLNEESADEGSLEDEVLGLWPDALCAKVSGIPEHWIVLILHVVLLGKQKDAAEQSGASDTLHLQEFLRRAKTLEGCINKHVLEPELSTLRDSSNQAAAGTGSAWENVLDAIRHALQIYLYRRIYDVEALWLQDKVVKVRDCLLRIEAGDSVSPEMSGCVGVLWASFIASCEAEDLEVQRSFAGWYKRATKRTGMSTWLNSLTLSEQLWSQKRCSRGQKVTWIDLLREAQRQRQPLQQTCIVVG